MIIKSLKYFSSIYLFWMFFFVVGRILFLLYNYEGNDLNFTNCADVIFHSLRLDTSGAFYLLLPPFFYWIAALIRPPENIRFFHKLYFFTLIPIILLVTIADWEIYRLWGSKLDPNALDYLKYPAEALASSLSSPLGFLFLMYFILLFLFVYISRRMTAWFITSPFIRPASSRLLSLLNGLIVFIILIIGLRGGIQLGSINQSFAYFSKDLFLNHAAVNTTWNLIYSYDNRDKPNPYVFYKHKDAQHMVQNLYASGQDSVSHILKTRQPNIILILLESFSTEILTAFGNADSLTPVLDKISAQGLLFKNIYASGIRTDRGLVSIFSGYPSQPLKRIILKPSKIESLPSLTQILQSAGYNSAFYYGGQSEFSNIKSYLLTEGFSKIIDLRDFPPADRNSKWGVHDKLVFQKAAMDLKTIKEPFFTTILTLSSHEPFDVPMENVFPGKDRRSKYKNSVAYTDRSIGYFINSIQAESFYNNTLFIFISDHGYHLERGSLTKRFPARFHIPLIFYGPALKENWRGREILKIGGQTDLAATLLNQIGLTSAGFDYSKDLLNPNSSDFAYYVFTEGFGWVTPGNFFMYDHRSKSKTEQITNNSHLKGPGSAIGKAYLQILFEDYLER
ncbi:MAG: sulfatase-like hydrolase/transferase [Candidatus Neomarinimicrobiota bacterium]